MYYFYSKTHWLLLRICWFFSYLMVPFKFIGFNQINRFNQIQRLSIQIQICSDSDCCFTQKCLTRIVIKNGGSIRWMSLVG